MAKSDSVALVRVRHPLPCEICREPMVYGVEHRGDEYDEPGILGWDLHVLCACVANYRLRAARAVGAFAEWGAKET